MRNSISKACVGLAFLCMCCSPRASPTAPIWRATPTCRTSSRRTCGRARPDWAAAITGIAPEAIVDFARLYGRTRRSFIRVGYGFSRSRNGAASLHAVTCLPAVTGAWQYRGGGALYSNGGALSARPDADRGARRARPDGAQPRPVAHRRGPHRRPPRPRRRPAGHRDARSRTPTRWRSARIPRRCGRARPRRPLRLRPRAVHDRDGGDGRHRAAGHHLPRA